MVVPVVQSPLLQKRRWYDLPVRRGGRICHQQSAFICALATAYARPFTKSKGWPDFPLELRQFDSREMKLHERMVELRHTIFAHSDSKHYRLAAVSTGDNKTDVLMGAWPRITERKPLY